MRSSPTTCRPPALGKWVSAVARRTPSLCHGRGRSYCRHHPSAAYSNRSWRRCGLLPPDLAPCDATLDADVLLVVCRVPVPPRDRRVGGVIRLGADRENLQLGAGPGGIDQRLATVCLVLSDRHYVRPPLRSVAIEVETVEVVLNGERRVPVGVAAVDLGGGKRPLLGSVRQRIETVGQQVQLETGEDRMEREVAVLLLDELLAVVKLRYVADRAG